MENSIVIAKFMGPYIVLIGLGLLFNTKVYMNVMDDCFKNAALVYVMGLLTFVAGLAIVIFHNIWVRDWRVLITLFGWIALIKGVWLVVLPDTAVKITKRFKKDIKLAVIPWVIITGIGVFLIFKGFGA
ncbi:MAG: hypothetical protein JXB40_06475 [Candidatus Omnitrophica bacterium]|nr:hypothetical protein [Candidatus Omnitrophota bacterium]